MNKITKVAALVLAFAAMGCSSDDDGNGNGNGSCESEIAWFQPGKFQRFDMTQFGFPAGEMKMSFGECNGDGLVTTRQMFNMAGQQISTTTDLAYQEGDFFMMDVNSDGVDITKLYKHNAQLGDVWEQELADGRIITREVIDMDSLVTVPAGQFHCKVYKYSTSTQINDSYIFWNDEVGQVMEDSGFLNLKLKEYN